MYEREFTSVFSKSTHAVDTTTIPVGLKRGSSASGIAHQRLLSKPSSRHWYVWHLGIGYILHAWPSSDAHPRSLALEKSLGCAAHSLPYKANAKKRLPTAEVNSGCENVLGTPPRQPLQRQQPVEVPGSKMVAWAASSEAVRDRVSKVEHRARQSLSIFFVVDFVVAPLHVVPLHDAPLHVVPVVDFVVPLQEVRRCITLRTLQGVRPNKAETEVAEP